MQNIEKNLNFNGNIQNLPEKFKFHRKRCEISNYSKPLQKLN